MGKAGAAERQAYAERLATVVNQVGGQAELARLSGVSLRAIGDYVRAIAGPPRGSTNAKLAKGGGVRERWLAKGEQPMRDPSPAGAAVREPTAPYHLMNAELLALVLRGVEELLPTAGIEERAGLIALAYEHMAARRSTDEGALAQFFRQWVRTARAEPVVPDFHSPEVAGHRDAQGELFRRRSTDRGEEEPTEWPKVKRGGKNKVEK